MNGATLTLVRFFDAPRARLFDAFTTAEGLQTWFGPEGYTVPSARIDARPGGHYRIEMHSPEGGVSIVTGIYREVVRPERLVFTWAWLEGDGRGPETEVRLTFAARDGGTELTLAHSGFPADADRDLHAGGWASSFVCLDSALAGSPLTRTARPTVIGDPRSTFVRSVRLAFAEKDVSYTLDPQPPHSATVQAVHPYGRIPVFRSGAFTLCETTAIIRYVDEAFPGPRLMPTTARERALAEQWSSIVTHYVCPVLLDRFILPQLFPGGTGDKLDPARIDAALAQVQHQLAVIEQGYAGKTFLASESPTLPDLLLAPLIAYLQILPAGPRLLVGYPGIRRAHAALSARASFGATDPGQP